MSVNLAGLSNLILHDEVSMSRALNVVIANAGCGKISIFSHTNKAKLWLDRFSPQLAIPDMPMDDDEWCELVVSLIRNRVSVGIYSEDVFRRSRRTPPFAALRGHHKKRIRTPIKPLTIAFATM